METWLALARPQQVAPVERDDWTTWMLMGGRGSGKTRAGAEWVRGMVTEGSWFSIRPVGSVALVGQTYSDVRNVMVEGESGILANAASRNRPRFLPSRRRLEWDNGAVAQLFSAEDPEALRGPQFGAAWCDEIGKWRHGPETWDMLQFGLRLGDRPRQCVTTTPRTTPLVRRLMGAPLSHVDRMRTADNAHNLAPSFLTKVVERYRGTRLGRQELEGELIEDRADALWSRDGFEAMRCDGSADLKRIVVAVDPPATGHEKSDACGIIVAGITEEGVGHVIADRTLRAVSPARWSREVAQLFERFAADRIVIETNQGGDMAEAVLRQAEPNLPIRQVKARRGKYVRAEPVAHLYERGMVRHVRGLEELEDEMCDFGLDGLSGGRSPDRVDALVWALTDLMLMGHRDARIRPL